MYILITYTNGESEPRHVRDWLKDKYGVTWFKTLHGTWEHSFLVSSVRFIAS